jgi:stage V sporulation protein B
MFNAIVLLSNAVMQAYGHVVLPVVNMFVGGVLKLLAVFILTGNPLIGILGTPVGSLLCYLSITVLNLIAMAKVFPNAPKILRNMLRAITAAVIMGVFVFGAYYAISTFLPSVGRVITCGLQLGIGVIVYLFSAIKLRAITREDCLLLPKGEKIAKLLNL